MCNGSVPDGINYKEVAKSNFYSVSPYVYTTVIFSDVCCAIKIIIGTKNLHALTARGKCELFFLVIERNACCGKYKMS